MAHNYDVGTRAWQPDASEGWVASEVASKNIERDRVKLVFQLTTGEVSDGPRDSFVSISRASLAYQTLVTNG